MNGQVWRVFICLSFETSQAVLVGAMGIRFLLSPPSPDLASRTLVAELSHLTFGKVKGTGFLTMSSFLLEARVYVDLHVISGLKALSLSIMSLELSCLRGCLF